MLVGGEPENLESRDVPDPARAADLPEFIALLGALRLQAGAPSYRTLARRVGPLLRPPRPVSQSTVGAVFQTRRRRLDLDLAIAIVRALGSDEPAVDRWRQAYLRIQRDANAVGPAGVFRQLPPDLATFTGRRREVDRLMTAATGAPTQATTVPVMVIEGMAGVGKTQLALHTAHQLVRAGHYTDLQLYANLRGYDPDRPPADPAAVLDSFLRQLGVAAQHVPQTLEERVAMFRDRMHARAALVVLDNAAEACQVRDLIPSSPTCLVVITSRRSLTELPDATVVMLDVFEPQESLQLLGRIAGPDRVGAEPHAARQIAELSGGLPLAVALAAARLRSRPAWSLQKLAERLAKGAGAEPGVTAVFDLSYRGLPTAAQRVLRLLGTDPGLDTTVDSVAALAAIDLEEADHLLELLQDEHLLLQQAPGRYELHDLVRAFAAERCRAVDSPAERNAASTRWLDWNLHSVYAATDLINRNRYRNGDLPRPPALLVADPADGDQARAWLSAERANLLAATRYAGTDGWPGHAWRFTQALWAYYYQSGLNSDWAESLHHGLAAAEADGNVAAQAELWHARGNLEVVTGRFDLAVPATREALRLRKIVGDRAKTASTLGNLACVLSDMGQYRQGMEIFHEALTLMRETGDRHGEASCLHNMGIGACAMGRHRQALDLLAEALELYRESGSQDHQTFILVAIGLNTSLLGEHNRAAAAVAEAVALAERTGADRRLAPAINVLGMLATERGDYEEAARAYRRAQALAGEIGDWGEETEALFELGVNALRAGDPSGALEFLDQAAARLNDRTYHRWILLLPQHRGDALLALGDLAGAAELYQRVLASEEDSESVVRARAAYGMARVALTDNPPDHHTARTRLHEALGILEEAEYPALKHALTATLGEFAHDSPDVS
ncbi:tetratricopeptide repeat protein [Kitasatospora sp. YST-16]|uniref:tetratricopeptide repeat protein n=1 Tax=Kitasatospora sp. YST-16 TaxID=2998080 RepID=UPI0022835223|nr:tetratricopeptide repeat protein [Kitasatospora sp. YST-16]WAL76050.1 tetratricopeptide repeat protein [Kitasatospora sp. YST-16]WNW42103.1 tetratricopeptide repeat protein [Streptomyces sp. Li-HN-5-13]